MATPSTGSDSEPSGQPTATKGGASSKPTPANNVSGGGAGPEARQGYEGLGHEAALNARSTIGSFLGLQGQKKAAEHNYMHRCGQAVESMPDTMEDGVPTCADEDHSFMGCKPGASDTLPGWNAVKSVLSGESK